MISLEAEGTTDILVIGGGIIGVCSAYYLAKEGHSVTLVERGEIASGCSYGNGGLLPPSHSLPLAAPGVVGQGLKWMFDPESPFYIRPRLDGDLIAWLWRFQSYCRQKPLQKAIPLLRDLQRTSLELYRELVEKEELECHFEQVGGLGLFMSVKGFEHVVEEVHLLRDHGLRFDILDAAATREMEPAASPDVVGGIFQPEDAHIDPVRFVRGLADRAIDLGATLRENTEVLALEASGGGIGRVRTTRGDYAPEQIVLAAGAWSGQVARELKLKLPLQPAKGYSVTVRRPGNFPRFPLRLGEAKVVATPMGDRLRFAGTLELAGYDARIDRRRVNAIIKAAGRYLPGVEAMDIIEIWRGFRPVSPDGLPYIGRSRSIKNLIVACAHAHLGVSMGPVTGKLVSQIAASEEPIVDVSATQVERFERPFWNASNQSGPMS
jgi:D-amino-acid dehydrogenase